VVPGMDQLLAAAAQHGLLQTVAAHVGKDFLPAVGIGDRAQVGAAGGHGVGAAAGSIDLAQEAAAVVVLQRGGRVVDGREGDQPALAIVAVVHLFKVIGVEPPRLQAGAVEEGLVLLGAGVDPAGGGVARQNAGILGAGVVARAAEQSPLAAAVQPQHALLPA